MKTTLRALLFAVSWALAPAHAGNIVIVGNSDLPKLDAATILKIYTGKIISVAGISVTPVGLKPGASVRNRFLQDFLGQDEDKYTAYWTVRRYIGKGTPPAELKSVADVLGFVQSTPGALAYVDEDDLKGLSNVNVITRR